MIRILIDDDPDPVMEIVFVICHGTAQTVQISFSFRTEQFHRFNEIFFITFRPKVRDAVILFIVDYLIRKRLY